jgi:hypothetical protein
LRPCSPLAVNIRTRARALPCLTRVDSGSSEARAKATVDSDRMTRRRVTGVEDQTINRRRDDVT